MLLTALYCDQVWLFGFPLEVTLQRLHPCLGCSPASWHWQSENKIWIVIAVSSRFFFNFSFWRIMKFIHNNNTLWLGCIPPVSWHANMWFSSRCFSIKNVVSLQVSLVGNRWQPRWKIQRNVISLVKVFWGLFVLLLLLLFCFYWKSSVFSPRLRRLSTFDGKAT